MIGWRRVRNSLRHGSPRSCGHGRAHGVGQRVVLPGPNPARGWLCALRPVRPPRVERVGWNQGRVTIDGVSSTSYRERF